MDIRDEISLSKDHSLPKSSSLRASDQNKHRNKLLGVKDKPQPVSEFNPTTGIQVLNKAPVVADKPTNVVKDMAGVVKPLVVKDKVKEKAPVKKPAAVVVKDSGVVVKEKASVKDKDKAPLVKDKYKALASSVVVNDPAEVDKDKDKKKALVKDKDKAQVSIVTSAGKGKKSDVGMDKATSDISKDKPKNIAPEVVKERRKTELPND
ncbi:hypothetical protein Tco_1127597, partial [Tanacetum coccineum]